MNQAKAANRFATLSSGALLGVTAIALTSGCNRTDTPEADATLVAASSKPAAAAPMQAGSMPPGMQNGAAPSAPVVSSAPSNVPNVMSASAPVAPALAPMSKGGEPISGRAALTAPAVAVAPVAAPVVAPPAAPTAAPVTPYSNAASPGKSKVAMVLATPAGAAPRLVPGTLALKAQLKRLWNKGAAAKHRGDIAGARRAWLAARKLAPQWPGFQESLDKLG